MSSYENLSKKNSDKYQFVFPYYNYNRNILSGSFGALDFNSNGNNNLSNTNVLKTSVINNLSYTSNENIFNNLGIVSNFELYIKNLNKIGKNDEIYTSNLKSEISSIYIVNSSIPYFKSTQNSFETLIPKISLRFNPGDMLNYNNLDRNTNTSNIVSINRLGFDDTLESGKSLTFGIEYKHENIDDENNFFKIDLATVFRDREEKNIPNKTTLNKKNSNLFGLFEYNFSELLNLNYEFQLDNKFQTFELNNISVNFNTSKFATKIKFIEENGLLGNTNLIENNFTYKFDDKNNLTFQTRRNRTINLTEYYDIIYDYKNDCLAAGIKYKKTYYSDRELKPMEDLMFFITIYPITTFEQKIDQDLYRN